MVRRRIGLKRLRTEQLATAYDRFDYDAAVAILRQSEEKATVPRSQTVLRAMALGLAGRGDEALEDMDNAIELLDDVAVAAESRRQGTRPVAI